LSVHTDTHTRTRPTDLSGPLKWSINNPDKQITEAKT